MQGGVAFAEEPIAGLPEIDDVSAANPLTSLLADAHADLAFMLRARPYDPATGAERDVLLSTHGYADLGDGSADREGIERHAHFPSALASAYNVKVNLLSGGAWQASAVPGYGAVAVANPDGKHDELTLLNWDQRDVTVWVGRRAWIGPSFRYLGKVFAGTVERVTWDTGRILLHIRDLRHLFEQEVNPEAYLGFGTAVRLRAQGDKVTVAHHVDLEPTDGGGNRVVFCEVMVEVPVVADAVIATKGGAAGWRAVLWSDGAVGLFDRDLGGAVTRIGVVRAGVPVRLSFAASQAGLRILADGIEVAQSATPYGAGVRTEVLIIGAAA